MDDVIKYIIMSISLIIITYMIGTYVVIGDAPILNSEAVIEAVTDSFNESYIREIRYELKKFAKKVNERNGKIKDYDFGVFNILKPLFITINTAYTGAESFIDIALIILKMISTPLRVIWNILTTLTQPT